ncbi:hypothetical protein [Rhodanobacter lindaniclasticus]|nr:hypothetical protein [Rhodanobacter lindaniclasticus]
MNRFAEPRREASAIALPANLRQGATSVIQPDCGETMLLLGVRLPP